MRAVRAWFVRLGEVVFKQRRDAELAAEIESHLQMHIEDGIRAGMMPAEARRQAVIALGGVEQTKESYRDRRGFPALEAVIQDARFGLRMLRKNPGFTAVAVLTLALGIGASTIVFSVFYNLLFNAFAAKNASRLVVPVVPPIHLSDLDIIRDQNQVFENLVGWANGIVLVSDGPLVYQFYDARVTPDAFEFYGVPPLLGRSILPGDGKPGSAPVFVMSYKTWKADFNGDPTILGKNFAVDGEPRTLVGIMPPRFQAYGPLQQIWIPITWEPGTPRSDRDLSVVLMARLKPRVSLQTASADLDVIVKHLAILHPNDFPKYFTTQVQSATDALMGPSGLGSGSGAGFRSDLKHLLYDLFAAVMMLLLISCSNVANLLLARATAREKEIAVRAALGATRGRIARQLLVESFVLAIPACIVGCIFAVFGTKAIVAVIPQKGFVGGSLIGGETVIGLNPAVLLFALGITLLTTMICGMAPALHVVRGDLQPRLVGSGKGENSSFRHGMFRAGLVISEVALSIVLLVGAGLMIHSLFLLTRIDLGFNPRNILVAYFGPHTRNQLPDLAKVFSSRRDVVLRQVTERLRNLPGVAAVATEDTIPGYGPQAGPEATVPGATHAEAVGIEGCDEELLRMLEMRLIQGNWLSKDEVQTGQYVAVINQTLARDFFGDENPLGRQLKVKAFRRPTQPSQDAYFQIIGVVADVKNRGPQQPAMPMVFIPHTISGSFFLLLKTTIEPASLMRAVQEQVWAVDPDEVFWAFNPLDKFLQQLTYAIPEFAVMTLASLACIGLLLVVVGIFSVLAYTVSLQTREIGIRMALGAQPRSIVRITLTTGAKLIAVGIMVGVFASYALTRFLVNQLWGVSPTDPWTFAAVIAVITGVGLSACAIPALRAMRVDPAVALRHE